jgi:DNA-binding MarR family transcriptional regulator
MTKKTELLEELVLSLRAAQAATDAMDEAATKALGINRTDGRAVDIVDREGPLTAGRLAELCGITTAAVTALLDRLEKAGYARRVADPGDRRRVLVELTPLTEQRIAELYGPLGELGRERVERYTIEELELLIEFNRLSQQINERRAAEVRELRFD